MAGDVDMAGEGFESFEGRRRSQKSSWENSRVLSGL